MPCSVGVPRFNEFTELALPAWERRPAGEPWSAEFRDLVEGALGVDRVAVEEGNVDRGCAREHERVHRGGMELQVDLRRSGAVGAADRPSVSP